MRFTKPLSETKELKPAVTSREWKKYRYTSGPQEGDSKTLPEAIAEVATWSDAKLHAIGYKIGTGRWAQHLIVHFESAVKAALIERKLPMHPCFITECCVCKANNTTGGKAIYRVGKNAFCSKHKLYARMEQGKLSAAIDKLAIVKEKAFEEFEKERVYVDKLKAINSSRNRAHRGKAMK